MPESTAPAPARRADAERNREKILAAARDAFGGPSGAGPAGADVSMAEISRRAGVGMATLYRNFPGRRELLEALYVDEVDAVCDAAAAPSASPGAALMAWLPELFAFFTNKHDIASELLERTDSTNPVFDGSRARVIAAGTPLLAAAQAAGEVRADLGIEQVLGMVGALAKIQGEASYREPILQAALDGLRRPAA